MLLSPLFFLILHIISNTFILFSQLTKETIMPSYSYTVNLDFRNNQTATVELEAMSNHEQVFNAITRKVSENRPFMCAPSGHIVLKDKAGAMHHHSVSQIWGVSARFTPCFPRPDELQALPNISPHRIVHYVPPSRTGLCTIL